MSADPEGAITKQLLKCESGEFDIESIHSLNLRAQGITDLGCLGECLGLEILDLSFNDLHKLHALAGLNNLSSLNLTANRITSLEGLQSLDNLQILNVAGNLIGSIDDLKCLTSLEKLRELRLRNSLQDLTNPVCMNTSYRDSALKVLPNLVVLDGERLSGKGSDLFRLFNEMDKALGVISDTGGGGFEIPESTPWMTENLAEIADGGFQSSCLADADKQLEALLADCKRLTVQADQKIQAKLAEGTALKSSR